MRTGRARAHPAHVKRMQTQAPIHHVHNFQVTAQLYRASMHFECRGLHSASLLRTDLTCAVRRPRDEDHGGQDLHEFLRSADLRLHAVHRTLLRVGELLAPQLQLLVLLDCRVGRVRDVDVLRGKIPDCIPQKLAVVAVRVVRQAVLRYVARLDVVHKVVVDEVRVEGTKAGYFNALPELTG